jgi:hypothetical protein
MAGFVKHIETPGLVQYQLATLFDSVQFSITAVPSWLTVFPSSGMVTTSPLTVTFSVNDTANALATGTHGPTSVTFSNTTNNEGTQTRTATSSYCRTLTRTILTAMAIATLFGMTPPVMGQCG